MLEGRTSSRWTYSAGNTARCPWCNEDVTPRLKSTKTKRKKAPLSILYCPHCEEVWQYRGELPDEVVCPTCTKTFNSNEGNMPEKGKFICRGTCGGNVDAVIVAIRICRKTSCCQLGRMQSKDIVPGAEESPHLPQILVENFLRIMLKNMMNMKE